MSAHHVAQPQSDLPTNMEYHHREPENPKLGIWVSQQRCLYKRGKLPSNRIDVLNKIAFEWVGIKEIVATGKWMNMFQKLVEYKKQHKITCTSEEHNKPK